MDRSTLPYASKLNTAVDEHLYLSSITDFDNDTTIDKENTLRSRKNLATTLTNRDNRAFIIKVYENENENENGDTEDDTYLISLKSIEDSPYYFPSTKMSHTSDTMFVNYQPPDLNISEHYTQTRGVDYYDHSTNTDEGYEDGSSNPSRFDSIPSQEIYLTPSKYRPVSRKPLSNIFPNTNINSKKQSDDYETLDYGDRILTPTKYRLQQDRIKKLLNNENTYYPQEQSQIQIEQQRQPQNQNKLNQELPQQKQSQYDQRQKYGQRNGSNSEILPQQQQFRKGTELEEEPLQQKQQHQSHYHPKQQSRQQSRLTRESSPEQQEANYYELDSSQKQSESARESPSRQHQSQYQQREQLRPRTKSAESLQQQQSPYHQQGQLQNQNTLVQNSFATPPQQQQSQYHQRQPSRQQNGSERESSPQQQKQSNYYEIDQSQIRSGLARESPPGQQQSQYHKQGQLQNQNTRAQNPLSTPPPQQQQSQYHQRQQIRQQNGFERESSPQQQQSNYYELDQAQKRSGFVRESLPRQQQSRQRNELEQDPLDLSQYYDEIAQPQVEPDEELQVQPRHRQQQLPIEIISQDNSKPFYNRYQVIAGDFEIRESPYDNSSPTNASKPGQMQLIFKATLQGPEVQERAKNSISELVSNRSRSQSTSNINKQNNLNKTSYPNSPQSSTNVDRRNQNTTNIASNRETEYQIRSNHNSRLNSISHTVQSPTTRTKPDHDNYSTGVNYPSFQPSSPPNEPIKRPIYDDRPSAIESYRQSNNQSPLSIQSIAANMNTHSANDNDLNGIYERSRSSSQNYTSSKYEKNPLRQTDNSRSSPLLSPPRSLPIPFEPKSKYFFGEKVQNQLSDDEEDNEVDCETFGHDSQPRPLTTTNTTRNLDYPSATNSRFSMNDNNYPQNLQFGQQTDVGTATSNSLIQGQQHSSSTNQSTLGKTRDSPRDLQTSTTNKQISGVYPVQTTRNAVNQIISNATTSTSGFQQQNQNDSDHFEQNLGRNIKQERSSSKSDRDRDNDNQSQYGGDDDGRDNDNIDEYQDDDHDIQDQIHDDPEDTNYINNDGDEDDNLAKFDESDQITPQQSGVNQFLNYNPVLDASKNFPPMRYPPMDTRALPSASNISSTTQKIKKKGKKPLEITVRTADHSHLYTPGIIPPKSPSTPTTDITDEITEREPFDKSHTFRHKPDPYLRDSRDNNEGDAEDSDAMSEVRQHNRDRWAKNQSKFKNYGTQSEEKSTRTIGTMSEPVKTRNFGNDVQPQSSATQTSSLLQQQSLYKLTEQDDIDSKPSTSQRARYDSRTNGYYPSQRPTSVGHQNKYVPSSSISPRQKDYSDYDQHQEPHLSQYNDDPRDQYTTTRNDYQRSTIQRPHYSSQTRQHIPSSTNLHRTSPPTVEYRSASPDDRYRTPSPSNHHRFSPSQRSRSPSPPIQKHISTSTNRQRTVSPPSQRRSPSPPIQKHISTSTSRQRTVSPPYQRRSPSPPTQKHISTSTNRQRTVSPPSQRRSPSPPIQKHISTSTSRQHTASPPSQRRSRQLERSPSPPSSRHHRSSSTKLHRTPSPKERHRSPPSSSKNHSRKTKDRRQMVSTETDTSLDGMKPQQHRGSQPESPSTREYGTTTSTDRPHPPQTSYSTNPNARSSISQYQTLNSSLPKRQDYTITSPYQDDDQLLQNDQTPSTRKNYRLRPVRNDSNVNNYEQIPSKHDESISAEYNPSFDRPKEYTSKPFTGDRHQQASATVEQRSDEEEEHINLTITDDGSNEKYFRDLPIGGSISIPSATVIQPDTLPRSHGQNKSPTYQKHDRVQYREKITESPLRHGQQRIASIGDSPPLNFGSQNFIYQSPTNEFTTPFETRYIYDTDNEFRTTNNDIRSSTLKRDGLKSKNNRILLLPVLNSSRTYVFEKQPLSGNHIRQSRTNGNFYLATSPTLHSLNSSFQVDDSEIDSTNLNRYGLRSQVA